MDIHTFQKQIGIQFQQEELLTRALTHRSFANEQEGDDIHDNERLEFLGDAVLDFIMTRVLYDRYPDMPEGELTRLRSALVRTETLADLARQMNMGEVLRMGKGEETSGGRERRNILCDAFEALLAAIYLDQGLQAVQQFVVPLLSEKMDYILQEGLHIDARSTFQEWSQAVRNITPVYRVIEESGPDHEKQFMVEVLLEDEVAGEGSGRSKQSAAQSAAREALRRLEESGQSTQVPTAERSATQSQPSDDLMRGCQSQ